MQRNESLRQERIARNWRQQDVADQLGTTITTIQRWERGSQHPSAYYCIKLCTIFGKSAQELGLREMFSPAESTTPETEPAGSILSKEHTLWTVPHARNPHFTGRDDLLEQLEQLFGEEKRDQREGILQAALTQTQAIKGLGGIGKTQIAVEYAYRAREQGRYRDIIWISAANEETILTSFVALARLLPAHISQQETDQRTIVTAILRWLERRVTPWLLIFDNADDLYLVQPYFPRQGNGHILLTTRASAVGAFASSIEVDTMGIMEGVHLLLRRANLFSDPSQQVIDEALNIVIALAQFPLAIDQAGAYIEETRCSLHNYLQIYQQHRYELLARRGKQNTSYPESVATTWSLSFAQVQRTNAAAAELLHLCAFLSPDHIPAELLIEGAAHWPPLLQEKVTDPFTLNQMLEPLLSFSLVKRLSEERMLSLHRLVQVVQVEQMSHEEQRQWAERLVRAVNEGFPRDPQEVASWTRCQRYLEQVQACDALIQEQDILLPEAADLLDRAGTYLHARALYALAEPLYQRALHIWEQQAIPDPAGKARSLNNLARLFFSQDKLAQAEPLHQQALHIREQLWGTEHPDVAESIHDLAALYKMQGKYTQAEPLYLRALRIREQQLGPEHPLVAESAGGLAVLYKQQGKFAEAEQFYLQALHIREQQLGAEHLQVAESSNDLAVLYAMRGKHTEAEQLYLRALRIWKQQLGAEHLMVAYALIGLALLYRDQEEYTQAEPLYLQVLHIWEQQLGSEHRNLAHALSGLAEMYRRQGRYAEAEPLYQRALRIRKQSLGHEHPLLAVTLDGLATLYSTQEKFSEAEALYQRALDIREKQLGQDHPETGLSLRGMANLYSRQGRNAEAEPLYVRALQICEQRRKAEDLETANVLHDFADFQQGQGHIGEAIRFYQRALTIREHMLGLNSPGTIHTRTRLQEMLAPLEQTEEAAAQDGRQASRSNDLPREALPPNKENASQEKNTMGSSAEEDLVPACPQCQQTDEVLRSGKNRSGSQRFRCRACQLYFTPQPGSRQPDPAHKAQALALAKQGMSYRQIARRLGVHHQTVSGWIGAHGAHGAE